MSVLVNVFGAKPESDEYQCALALKEKFEKYFSPNVIGEIFIQANATLFGQTVKDVDIIMMGTLQNYSSVFKYVDADNNISEGEVQINSFCTVIEVKSHGTKGVLRQGTEFFVRYGKFKHSVTSQSNDQKIAAKRFFEQTTNYSPFITNLIWFTGITESDLNELLRIDETPMPTNAFANDFSIKRLMQLLLLQRKPSFYKGHYVFDSRYNNCSPETLHKQFQLFGKEKHNMGELTRKRIEMISSESFKNIIVDDKMSIIRGRAGTGKTVGLIQAAIRLVDEEDKRVLILTYNKALVSDIRRLFALAELPDMFKENCVAVNTMHFYLYHIISKTRFNDTLSSNDFLENYEKYILDYLEYIKSADNVLSRIRETINDDIRLRWDYCLIDEAQDWLETERDIIALLFGLDHLVVADGGQQFVRNNNNCDWNISYNRNNIKLKFCLRQKSNLIRFINHYSSELELTNSKIVASDKMPGGRVIVCSSYSKLWEVMDDVVGDLKASGNIMYDMIILTPSDLVNKEPREFVLKRDFENHNIFVWDATNDITRSEYPVSGDEARVLQYDSARGLEAWTVVCLNFDSFINEKTNLYSDNCNLNSTLILESKEERRRKYILNWTLIPLTRAIDTLVITLDSVDSETAAVLKKIAEENPDYVMYI